MKELFFCTLFDSHYLLRALAMYESLSKHCEHFTLYIVPFDELTLELLENLKLKNITLIPLKDFENDELLSVKSSRTRAEYCWTSTPYIIDYCIKNYNLDDCVYIDADLYFYSNPKILLEENPDMSVLITEHRFSKRYRAAISNGIYCVQFVYFKNDENGHRALNWWRNACFKWCYSRLEDNKFGDQKYLDDWTTRFDGVHVLENNGGGLAPWNIQQYSLFNKNSKLFIRDKKSKIEGEMVFYHFHNITFQTNQKVDLGNYKLADETVQHIYKPYIKHIISIKQKLEKECLEVKDKELVKAKLSIKKIQDFLTRLIKYNFNFYKIDTFI